MLISNTKDMLPKKIYLNYVDENDKDKTWSEEPISVYDCKMQNREYTDLSQLWHLPNERPKRGMAVVAITDDCDVVRGDFDESRWGLFQYTDWMADWNSVVKWTYLMNFINLMK